MQPDLKPSESIEEKSVFLLTLTLGLAVCLIFLLHEIILYSRNTPRAHPDWISGKNLLCATPFGDEGDDFRTLYSRNRLNLHEWHSFNEYFLNRIFQPGLIRFRFYIEPNSYVHVIFNKTQSSFSGIRFSRNPKFPGIFFRASRDGQYLEKLLLENTRLSENWHTAELKFHEHSISIACDSTKPQFFPDKAISNQVMGFLSGKKLVQIDDVDVYDRSGKRILFENFRNHNIDWPFLIGSFLVLALASFFLVTRAKPKTFFRFILAEFLLLVLFCLYLGFDYYYWSTQYHLNDQRRWKLVDGIQVTPVESVRQFIFYDFPFYTRIPAKPSERAIELTHFLSAAPGSNSPGYIAVIGNDFSGLKFDIVSNTKRAVESYLKRLPSGNRKTILILGSSQMFGSGAMFPNDRIAVKMYEVLRNAGLGDRILLINASVPGSTSAELLKRCKGYLYLFRPEIVMINLSNNDLPKDFLQGLKGLSAWASTIHARVIFIQEANSPEVPKPFLIKKHAVMAEVAQSINAPLLPLHAHMSGSNVYDSGFLWWDPVHMTSYGQRKAGEFLGEELIKTGFLKDPPAGYNQRSGN